MKKQSKEQLKEQKQKKLFSLLDDKQKIEEAINVIKGKYGCIHAWFKIEIKHYGSEIPIPYEIEKKIEKQLIKEYEKKLEKTKKQIDSLIK